MKEERKTYPRLLPLPHTPPHDPVSTDASATNVWAGSVRVRWESSQRRPKADRWPDVDKRWGNPPTSHRGNPEGQRDNWQQSSQQPPARDRRHKPKIPSAWGDGRFILTTNLRSAHRPLPSIIVHHRSGHRMRSVGVRWPNPRPRTIARTGPARSWRRQSPPGCGCRR